jgi:ABC-type multidrug transport system fused ATPase/permease subunit
MPLLLKGFRQRRLGAEDLPPLEAKDESACSYERFMRQWNALPPARGRTHGRRVVTALYGAFKGSFWRCAGVLIISTCVNLSVPLTLNALLAYLAAGRGGVEGYGLALALFALVVVQSLTEHQFWILGVRCQMRAQSALMAACFRKAMWLSPDSRRQYSNGELINLLSVDACRVADTSMVPMFHWGSWCSLVMLSVSLTALSQLLGLSALVGICILVTFLPLGYMLGKRGKRASAAVQTERDRRSRLMSEALDSIRLVKSLQWEDHAMQVMQEARAREVSAQMRRSACFGGNGVLVQIAQVMAPLASFACRILVQGQPLTAATAFTAIAWFNILKRPLNIIPSAMTSLFDCFVSWDRLEALLLAPEASRKLAPPAPPDRIPWAVQLERCSYTWAADAPPALKDVTLRICEGMLVVVVGPVGAGKSTLLHSLIGDCLLVGDGRCEVRGSVSYVPQKPWVMNTTVRDNIVYGARFGYDQARFQDVVNCCGLRLDLKSMPGGETMEVGEDGTNISGGQQQRLNLAVSRNAVSGHAAGL